MVEGPVRDGLVADALVAWWWAADFTARGGRKEATGGDRKAKVLLK